MRERQRYTEREICRNQFSASPMWVPQLVRLGNRHLYLRSHLAACDQKGRKFRMLTVRGLVDQHLLYLCF